MKVVIVEDSSIVRERLVTMLAGLDNIEIIGLAQDAIEAIDLIQKHHPGIVLLDMRLPRGSGFDVLEHIKRGQDATLVMVLTNQGSPIYRDRCLAAGAALFFDKATEFDKAIEALKGFAQQRKSAN